jgi:hypothetical protein
MIDGDAHDEVFLGVPLPGPTRVPHLRVGRAHAIHAAWYDFRFI